jgi:hypothetical protein
LSRVALPLAGGNERLELAKNAVVGIEHDALLPFRGFAALVHHAA